MSNPVHARVVVRSGRATLMLNDKPTAPLFYALPDCPGARWTWEEVPSRNIGLFAAQGVRLFQAGVFLEHMVGADGKLDISLARRQVAGILAVCPEAKVMLRVHLHTPPEWWAANPDECVGYADGPATPETRWGLERPIGRDNEHPVRASFYSEKWRAWARGHLRAFCAELSGTREGAAVFALQVAYGVYGEWHQFGFFSHEPDTGPAATAAFRTWLQGRYGEEAALATAWDRPGLRWADAACPDAAARARADIAGLRDPRRQRAVVDYYTFLHEGLADAIIMMAQAVREAWGRPVVTATFFGYYYCMFGRQAAGGHLALARVLASPHVDCLCASPTYTPTAMPLGGTGHSKSLVDAVRRAGKLWLDEMDRATSVSGCPWDRSFTSTIPDDIAVLRRNLLQPATRGGGAWCFDFGPLAGTPSFARVGLMGWWDQPQLQEEIGRLQALIASRQERPYRRAADVLVLHDPWAFAHLAANPHDPKKLVFGVMPVSETDPVSPRLVDGVAEALYQSGLIHDDALLSELPGLDLSPYRMVVLAMAPVLDAAQRRLLREKVAAAGRHLVLLGYCGWSDGQLMGPQVAGDWSGLPVRAHDLAAPQHTLSLDGVEEQQTLPGPFTVPAFAAGAGQVVGRWADGEPSAVCRTEPAATWWAFGLPPNRPAFWRALGRRAGCLVVNDHDETTLLGDGLLVVHTVSGGARELRLPAGIVVRAELPPRSTTVFDAETGARLLG